MGWIISCSPSDVTVLEASTKMLDREEETLKKAADRMEEDGASFFEWLAFRSSGAFRKGFARAMLESRGLI